MRKSIYNRKEVPRTTRQGRPPTKKYPQVYYEYLQTCIYWTDAEKRWVERWLKKEEAPQSTGKPFCADKVTGEETYPFSFMQIFQNEILSELQKDAPNFRKIYQYETSFYGQVVLILRNPFSMGQVQQVLRKAANYQSKRAGFAISKCLDMLRSMRSKKRNPL